ncbi:MAG TPA: energy transducer TonB [Bryobacteraceae bacterium]|nr:energy transducer TonB [Bryobacteraceae bacterium]
MFDQTFVDTQIHARRPWSMAVSLTLQVGLVGIVLLIPLLHPEVLTPRPETPVIYVPRVLAEVPVPVVVQTRERVVRRSLTDLMPSTVRYAPRRIVDLADVPEGAVSAPVGMLTGPTLPFDSFPALVIGTSVAPPPKPTVKIAEPPPPTAPIRVSTSVQAALLTFGPKPAYPPLAKATRTQGSVRLQAVIATDGSIRDLHALSGHPLLVRAAIETVSRWRYRPTLLNGQAVEVITEVDVNFTLSQ